MKKIAALFISLVMCLTILSGCGKSESGSNAENTSTEGGTFYTSLDGDPKTLNPLFVTDTTSHSVIGYLFAPLLTKDEEGNPVPYLAEELPTVSEDNKTITFKLKQGWKWHDGVELTAEDVKFSLDLILNDEVNSSKKSLYSSIESVEVIDPYTVQINMSIVDSQIMGEFMDGNSGRFIVPKHILENVSIDELETCDFSTNPIGNGLYKLDSWDNAERITLSRVEDNPITAEISKVVMPILPSSSTALMKLEAGELSITSIASEEIERVEANENLVVGSYMSSGFDCIQYNLQNEIFADKNVRQAISYAIDIEAIIDGIYNGMATPALSSYPRGLWAFNENTKAYNFDQAKAESLLEESGWVMGSSGYREKDGKVLEFELSTTKGNETREKLVVYLQNVLKNVGINVIPRIIESNTLWDDMDYGKFDAVICGYSTGNAVVQRKYYSEGGVFNSGKYTNPRIDELFDLIEGTFDLEEQKEYIYEIQNILAEDVPMTYLTNGYVHYAYTNKLQNVKFVDLSGWYEFENWYIEE